MITFVAVQIIDKSSELIEWWNRLKSLGDLITWSRRVPANMHEWS